MHEQLRRIASRAGVELFRDYGIQLRPTQGPPDLGEVLYCGVIGFSGDGLRGSVVLAGSRATLELSNPGARGPRRDWAGELANQLAGRIKNQLLGLGLEVWITTPVVLRGRQIAFGCSSAPEPAPLCFDGPAGPVALWLDVDLDDGVNLCPEASVSPLPEGATVLF